MKNRVTKNIVVFVAAISVISLPGQAWADKIHMKQVRQTLDAVISADFPELDPARIQIKVRSSIDPYTRGFPVPSNLLASPEKRKYEILIHPRVLRSDIGPSVVQAVMAHELAHVAEFSSRSRFSLIMFSIRSLVSQKFRRNHEWETDREVVRRGYGPGLTLYRNWMASRVKPKRLKKKMRFFLSLDEIKTEIAQSGRPSSSKAGR